MKLGRGHVPSLRDRRIADALFLIQIVGATTFGAAQFRVMQSTVEGVNTSWFAFWLAFLVLNLVLAINAHRTAPSRVSRQTVVIYVVWTAVISVDLLMLLRASGATWSTLDTITTAATLAGIGTAMAVGRLRGFGVSDPMMRATIAVFCRGVPQLTLAYNVWIEGGAGLSLVGIAAGHVIISLRLFHVWFSIRDAGCDRNRLGIAIGEAANELSWIVVTVVWAAVML